MPASAWPSTMEISYNHCCSQNQKARIMIPVSRANPEPSSYSHSSRAKLRTKPLENSTSALQAPHSPKRTSWAAFPAASPSEICTTRGGPQTRTNQLLSVFSL